VPKRGESPVGAPIWVDLFTSNIGRVRAFYEALFGWTSSEGPPDYDAYLNFSKDGALVAGCTARARFSRVPDAWNVYLRTDDIAATIDATIAHGGAVLLQPVAIADLGALAFVTDVGGALVGVWEPRSHRGFGRVAEPGAAAWFELRTRDYDATVEFYRSVFDWETQVVSDTSAYPYTMLVQGDEGLAGIVDATTIPDHRDAAHWSVYFGTAETDATLSRTVELGGRIIAPAEDTPYGRLAVANDPTGASFRLMQSHA
jgi:predicted enzyme related to lactoylglutathione lyase